nr:MAG TPA: hypothetical protein [Caudoviricetes sp.]
MAIDFSKLKPRELPTKKVELNILGIKQEIEIHPMTGKDRLSFWATDFIGDAIDVVNRRTRLALTTGASLSEEDAEKLIELDWDAALDLVAQVKLMTNEFDEALVEEKEHAEKNSPAADSTVTQA